MVSLKYVITKEDYINYYSYVMWDAPANKKKRLFYYAKQVVPLLLFLFAFYFTGLLSRPGNFILLIIGFIVFTSILSFFGVRANIVKQAEKVAEDPDNNSIFLELEVIVSDAGILVKDQLKETRYQWAAIIKKLESQNYYFLFHNSVQAIIIPKRNFKTTIEMQQFENLLRQNLSLEAEVSHLLKS